MFPSRVSAKTVRRSGHDVVELTAGAQRRGPAYKGPTPERGERASMGKLGRAAALLVEEGLFALLTMLAVALALVCMF